MDSVQLTIYGAGGTVRKATVNKWKFQDAMMGEQFITFSITSEVPIQWSVGDWCEFRGERYTLNYIPSVTQKAGMKESDAAFSYENVKFNSYQEELTRCNLLDVTPTTGDYVAALGTNYTGSSRFTLFCGETTANGSTLTAVCALAAKMQANLDRLYPTSGWHIYVDTETTYETASGETVLVTHTDDQALSFDNTTVAEALAQVNSVFDLDYCIRGRNIYIGYTLQGITNGIAEQEYAFGYGPGYASYETPGKSLFEIKQVSDSQQKIVTRLRALGSTKNMPYRYYNKKYGLSQSLFPTNLQLPGTFLPEGSRDDAADASGSTKWSRNNARSQYLRAVKGDTNDAYIDKNDDAASTVEGIREDSARWDGSNGELGEIYPTIEGMTFGELRDAGVKDQSGLAGSLAFQPLLQPNSERIDNLLAIGYMSNGALVDDANIGDGILTEEEVSRNGRAYSAVISQRESLYSVSGDGATSVKHEFDEVTLFTVQGVTPGSYFMSPTGPSYESVVFNFSVPNFGIGTGAVGYVLRVKQSAGGTLTTIAEYTGKYTERMGGRAGGAVRREMYLPEIPDVKETSSAQVESIDVTAACDVIVTFAPVLYNVNTQSDFSLTWSVGQSLSVDEPDYPPEYNWGLVDNSLPTNSPFHVFIKDMGFDLTATFTDDTPTMSMKSGACVGRDFTIGGNVQKATVGGKRGYLLTLNRATDSNLNTYYPSSTDRITAGDYFVLTGIEMPDAYIEAAEVRLLKASTDYLADNCETKFTYKPSLDDIFLRRNYDNMVKAGTPEKSIFWRLYAGLKFMFRGIPVSDDENTPLPYVNITIQQVSITMGDGLTPKVDLVLNDDVQQTTLQRLTTAVDRIYNGSANISGVGASDVAGLFEILRTEGGKLFLSKQKPDTASGQIDFLSGLRSFGSMQVGEYVPGVFGTGSNIAADGKAEFEDIAIRGSLTAAEFIFNRVSAEEGDAIRSMANGTILSVTQTDETHGTATLKIEGDDYPTIADGDICRGMFNTVIGQGYITQESTGTDSYGFQQKKGFFTCYFTVTGSPALNTGTGEWEFHYQLPEDEETGDAACPHPVPLMKFAQYGNTKDTDRQTSMYITAVGIAPRLMYLTHVNTYKIGKQNIVLALGNLNGITVQEIVTNTTTGESTLQDKQLSGDAGLFVQDNMYVGGLIQQFTSADYDYLRTLDPVVEVSQERFYVNTDSNGSVAASTAIAYEAKLKVKGQYCTLTRVRFGKVTSISPQISLSGVTSYEVNFTLRETTSLQNATTAPVTLWGTLGGESYVASSSVEIIPVRAGATGATGETGATGAEGPAGSDGRSSFKSTVFTRSATQPSTPAGGSYSNPLPDTSGWSDGVPAGDLQLWASTRIFTSDGESPQQSEWREPAALTNTADMEIVYSSSETEPAAPSNPYNSQADTMWTTQAQQDAIWMAIHTCINGIWGPWEISKIKGENGKDGKDGTNGTNGTNGTDGADGASTYAAYCNKDILFSALGGVDIETYADSAAGVWTKQIAVWNRPSVSDASGSIFFDAGAIGFNTESGHVSCDHYKVRVWMPTSANDYTPIILLEIAFEATDTDSSGRDIGNITLRWKGASSIQSYTEEEIRNWAFVSELPNIPVRYLGGAYENCPIYLSVLKSDNYTSFPADNGNESDYYPTDSADRPRIYLTLQFSRLTDFSTTAVSGMEYTHFGTYVGTGPQPTSPEAYTWQEVKGHYVVNCGEWEAGKSYFCIAGERQDYVTYQGAHYLCLVTHTSVGDIGSGGVKGPRSPKNLAFWQASAELPFVATKLLLAEEAYIENLVAKVIKTQVFGPRTVIYGDTFEIYGDHSDPDISILKDADGLRYLHIDNHNGEVMDIGLTAQGISRLVEQVVAESNTTMARRLLCSDSDSESVKKAVVLSNVKYVPSSTCTTYYQYHAGYKVVNSQMVWDDNTAKNYDGVWFTASQKATDGINTAKIIPDGWYAAARTHDDDSSPTYTATDLYSVGIEHYSGGVCDETAIVLYSRTTKESSYGCDLSGLVILKGGSTYPYLWSYNAGGHSKD